VYLGLADLVARWVYTRQGVHRLVKSKGFPPPAFTINQGRNPAWALADIEAFEQAHPEVLDEEIKRRKVTGYFLTLSKPPKVETAGPPAGIFEPK
jgi:hypothetical protein